jgi:hypothetical protein
MKVYRNYKEIRRKEKLGRRFSLVGLAVLFIGLLSSFIPTWYPPDAVPTSDWGRFLQEYWTWISFAALPLGFIFASIGSYHINRFARRRWPGIKTIARPDEMLERSMKGFDDKHSYFAWSLPANYVVAGPFGLELFAVRSDRGKVTVRGDRWREPFSFGRIFTVFAREGVGNPMLELDEQEKRMRTLLQNSGNSALAEAPIGKAAVFLNPQMVLTLENPTIPVLRADQVKDHLRRRVKEGRLPTETARALNEFLAAQSKAEESISEAVKADDEKPKAVRVRKS